MIALYEQLKLVLVHSALLFGRPALAVRHIRLLDSRARRSSKNDRVGQLLRRISNPLLAYSAIFIAPVAALAFLEIKLVGYNLNMVAAELATLVYMIAASLFFAAVLRIVSGQPLDMALAAAAALRVAAITALPFVLAYVAFDLWIFSDSLFGSRRLACKNLDAATCINTVGALSFPSYELVTTSLSVLSGLSWAAITVWLQARLHGIKWWAPATAALVALGASYTSQFIILDAWQWLETIGIVAPA